MFDEDSLLPLSALQHLAFCERQWGLIHLEQAWSENRLTAEGRVLHERVHEAESESRGGLRIARGLRLRSLRLGLAGIADVVEFHRSDEGWIPFPVEYKRGAPKSDRCDAIQLCAQAMCLEEMLQVTVYRGALFYGMPRRRQEVAIDAALRAETETLAVRMHALYSKGTTPAPLPRPACRNCSLVGLCLPKVATRRDARAYLATAFREIQPRDP